MHSGLTLDVSDEAFTPHRVRYTFRGALSELKLFYSDSDTLSYTLRNICCRSARWAVRLNYKALYDSSL